MKDTIKGFVEGASTITTGDTMKQGDHRRSKFKCKFFKNQICAYSSLRCMGSSHCQNYDDGISVCIREDRFDYEQSPAIKLLRQYILDLKYVIPLDSLEGKVIKKCIYEEYKLSPQLVELAQQQENEYQQYLRKIESLKREIKEYNDNLSSKCILIGLFIVTAPFSYIYYQKKKRNENLEINNIPEVILDIDLQNRVKAFKSEMKKCTLSCSNALQHSNDITGRGDFESARIYFLEKNYSSMAFHIQKAMAHKETSAILWLAEKCKDDTLNKVFYRNLLLYASYLGDKKAALQLSKMMLSHNMNSKLGHAFLNKSNKSKISCEVQIP